jgi:putative oxidoreductase
MRLVRTEDRVAPAIARLGLGLVMLPHALQKAFAWFGGPGFIGAFHMEVARLGIPGPLAFIAILTEIVCALLLILGALSRVAAVGIICVMLGAILYVHLPNGFFMNWTGKQAGEGFEYHLLAITLGLIVLLAGGGRASIDRVIMTRRPMTGGSIDARFVNP